MTIAPVGSGSENAGLVSSSSSSSSSASVVSASGSAAAAAFALRPGSRWACSSSSLSSSSTATSSSSTASSSSTSSARSSASSVFALAARALVGFVAAFAGVLAAGVLAAVVLAAVAFAAVLFAAVVFAAGFVAVFADSAAEESAAVSFALVARVVVFVPEVTVRLSPADARRTPPGRFRTLVRPLSSPRSAEEASQSRLTTGQIIYCRTFIAHIRRARPTRLVQRASGDRAFRRGQAPRFSSSPVGRLARNRSSSAASSSALGRSPVWIIGVGERRARHVGVVALFEALHHPRQLVAAGDLLLDLGEVLAVLLAQVVTRRRRDPSRP